MGYIVNQDIIDRVGTEQAIQASAEVGSTMNSAVLDECRLGSEGEANGYLAKRYQVPVDLSAHPDLAAVLKTLVLDIAVYRLMTRRPPAAENYKTARDLAIEWLRMVSEGKIILPADPPAETTTSEKPVFGWGSNPAVMSEMREL